MLNKIRYVVEKAKLVKINNDLLDRFILQINSADIHISLDNNLFHGIEDYEKKINALFVFGCMNFAFWTIDRNNKKKKIKTSQSKRVIKAVNNLLRNNKDRSLSKLLTNIGLFEFTNLMSNDELLLLYERWRNLREAGLILNYKCNDSYLNLLKDADFDAVKALSLTIKHFPSFNDRSIFHGQDVEFHKRAQILLGDISSIPNQLFKLKNIDGLIGGADYRIPQLLRHLKILEYSKILGDKIDNQELITSGSDEEVEIRAATLWAINLIKNKLNSSSKKYINAMEIDNYLWRTSKKFVNMEPHHRTISIYY